MLLHLCETPPNPYSSRVQGKLPKYCLETTVRYDNIYKKVLTGGCCKLYFICNHCIAFFRHAALISVRSMEKELYIFLF
jgi:hypothetical protein